MPVIWRAQYECPRCHKTAYYSSVWGYKDVMSGTRIYCPRCGYVETEKMHR